MLPRPPGDASSTGQRCFHIEGSDRHEARIKGYADKGQWAATREQASELANSSGKAVVMGSMGTKFAC
jgi:hypothetical protein